MKLYSMFLTLFFALHSQASLADIECSAELNMQQEILATVKLENVSSLPGSATYRAVIRAQDDIIKKTHQIDLVHFPKQDIFSLSVFTRGDYTSSSTVGIPYGYLNKKDKTLFNYSTRTSDGTIMVVCKEI